MKLQPLGDRIVVRNLDAPTKTASGILVPDSAKEKPQEGEVIAVGPGRIEKGERIPVEVKAGDRILYAKYGPTEVKVDGQELMIVKEEDVLAIVKGKE